MTMNRRQFTQTTAAIAAASALPLARAADVVKIGYVSPQTGPLAPFGEADRWVIDQMKTAFKDGLSIGGKKHEVQIILKDSQSNPNRSGEVANDLILKDKVALMLTAGTPETANPVSDVSELNAVPCISSVVPWQPWFFGRKGDPAKGFQWTYHVFWGLEDVIANFTNGWKSVQTNKKVGGLFPNDGDGNAWGDKERGFPKPLAAGERVELRFELHGDVLFRPENMSYWEAGDLWFPKPRGRESEAYAYHEVWLKARPREYGADVRQRLLVGAFVSGADYLKGQRVRGLREYQEVRLFEGALAAVRALSREFPMAIASEKKTLRPV